MLTGLSIRNVVLIEALDLAFGRGLGVLTGETGAGKSILLDSLGLVLGDRADGGLIRAGTDEASVTATFEFAALPDALRTALADAEIAIEPGEPLIIRRRLRAEGGNAVGSRAFVNDQPVSVALLRELARSLVELHGQHDDRHRRGHRHVAARRIVDSGGRRQPHPHVLRGRPAHRRHGVGRPDPGAHPDARVV